MIPAAFVMLDSLPLSAHGKVDRDALPAPEVKTGSGGPPRDAVERGVAALWEELLGVSGVRPATTSSPSAGTPCSPSA